MCAGTRTSCHANTLALPSTCLPALTVSGSLRMGTLGAIRANIPPGGTPLQTRSNAIDRKIPETGYFDP